MARPATGSPRWSEERQRWEARITLDGGVRKVVVIPDVAKEDTDRARRVAQIISDKARREGKVPAETSETVNEWVERWLRARTTKGLATVGHDRSRLTLHVLPLIGTCAMAQLTRDDVERVVESLDKKIRSDEDDDDHLSWKTAANVWALVTKMFDDAVNAKERELRVRQENPALKVRGPDRGASKAKVYLYPSEFLKLVKCKEVPLAFRQMYAVAVYLFARAGELQALTVGDVDLEHGVISITKAVDRKTGEIVATKSGETRRIPVEPRLRPLLKLLVKGKETADAVMWMNEPQERAVDLREHLRTAGVDRPELYTDDSRSRHVVFHDLRSTGITWAAVRGDDPLKIMQRAGHSGFETTKGYIREAENLRSGFGEPFPELPGEFCQVSVFRPLEPSDSSSVWRREGDSNPWRACTLI